MQYLGGKKKSHMENISRSFKFAFSIKKKEREIAN